jgi:2-polyprenyl-3-methyl-5-hydroxy-6-metoxy-1,4-benzoquinol methylase
MNEDVFDKIAATRAWGSAETISGPGSTIEACRPILERLPEWLSRYKIRKIVDLGCGDFNWLRCADLSGIEYDGYDVAPLAIAAAAQHAKPTLRFHQADIIRMEVPKGDLIILKDVLIHLPDKEALQVLGAIRKSGSSYFAATTSPGFDNASRKGLTIGAFSPINLEAAPFQLPAPLDQVEVPHREGNPRKLFAIWDL